MSNGGNIKLGIDFNVNKTPLNQLKASLQDLKRMTAQDLADINFTGLDEANKDLEKMQASVRKVERALDRAFNKDLGTLNLTKFNKELQKMDLNSIYENFNRAGDAGRAAFRNTTSEILTTNMQMKKTSKVLSEIGDTMKNTIKWGVASSVMNSFAGSVQQAFGYIKHLDSSLNDIRIVTGYSADEMDRFAEKANKAAKALAASTTDYTEASLIYYQQGLSGAEVESRAETTLKAANVTGQAAAEVSEQLTAVWNGYKVSAEETEMYVDKLAAVAASTAADLEELSTGMSKVASAAMTSGVNMDQLSATLATVISVTRQAPETVGTAFKTIYARLGDLAVDGVDEFGTTLGSVSKKMATMGIQILDEAGNLREMGTIVEEVAAQWDTWTEAQKQAAAVAMAGKRQYNNLISLFENWDMYESALLTSQTSLGTLSQQQEIYLDSAEASLRQLATSAEGVYDSLLDVDTIKLVANGLSGLLSGLEKFIDGIGGGSTVLLGLGAILTKTFSGSIAKGIHNTASNIMAFKNNTSQAAAAIESLDVLQKWANDAKNQVDEVTKGIIKMKAETLKASGVISEEEMNDLDNLISKHAEAQNHLDLYNSKQEQLGSKMFRLNPKEEGIGSEEWNAVEQEASRLKRENPDITEKELLLANESYQKLIEKIKSAEIAQKEYLTSLKNNIQKNIETLETNKFTKEGTKAAIKDLSGSIHKAGFSKETKEEIYAAIREFKEVEKSGTASAEQIKDSYLAAMQKIRDAIAKTEQDMVELRMAAKNAGTGEREALDNYVEATSQALQNRLGDIRGTVKIDGIVNAIGGVEQLSFGIVSLINGFKTLGDESLTAGERIGQFFLTVLPGVGMLLAGLSTVSAEFVAFMARMAAAGKLGTMTAAEITTLSSAITALKAVISPTAVAIGLLIAALGTAGVLIVREFNTGKRAMKEACDQAEDLRKQLEDVQQIIKDTENSLSNWENAVGTLSSLTEGTTEWTQKLLEANQYVLSLAQAYPELMKYITSNEDGLLTISPEGVQELRDRQMEQLRTAQSAQISGNINVLETENDNIKYGYVDYAKNFVQQDDARIIIQDLIENNGQASVDDYTQGQKKFYEQHEDELIKDYLKIAQNNANIDILNKQIATMNLSDDRAYNRLDNIGDKELVKSVYSKEYQEKFDKQLADLQNKKNWTTQELEQEYKKLIGATETRKGENGETEFKVGDEWYAASEAAQQNAIAHNKATESMEGFTHGLDDASKGLLSLKEGLLNLNKKNDKDGVTSGTLDEKEANHLMQITKDTEEYSFANMSLEEMIDFQKGVDKSVGEKFEYSKEFLANAGYENVNDDNFEQYAKEYAAKVNSLLDKAIANKENELKRRQSDATTAMENNYKGTGLDEEARNELYQNNKAIFDELPESVNIADFINSIEWEFAPDDWDEGNGAGWFKKEAEKQAEKEEVNANIVERGQSVEEIEEIADLYMQNAESVEEISDSLKDNENLAKEVASRQKEYNKALEKGVALQEDYGDILDDNDKLSEDWLSAQNQFNDVLVDTFNLAEGTNISEDILGDPNTWNLYKKYLEGDIEAFNKLSNIIIQNSDEFTNLGESMQTEVADGLSMIDTQLAENDFKIGATFDELGITNEINDWLAQGVDKKTIEFIADTKGLDIQWEFIELTHRGEAQSNGFTKISYPGPDGEAVTEDYPTSSLATVDGKVGIWKVKGNKSGYAGKPGAGARANTKGSGGGGGGGGSKPKKTYKTSEKKKDRYRNVNNSLKELSTELDRLAEKQEKLYGKDLLDNLNKQLKVIEKQVEKTKEKLAIAKQEAKEMRTQSLKNQEPGIYNDLLDFGIKFDAAGNISNYDKIFDQWDKKVQDLTDKYNKMSASAQEKDKDKDNGIAAQLEKASQNRDTLEKLIKDYDTLIYDTIPGLEDEITEMAYQQIEIKLEGFQIEADVRLDVKEALENWYDFEQELKEFINPKDFAGIAESSIKAFSDTAVSGVGEAIAEETKTLFDELQKWNADPKNYKGQFAAKDAFGNLVFDEVAFMEAIEENSEQLQDYIIGQFEYLEEVHDQYLEGIDAIADGYDEHIESLEFIGDQLQHNLRMTELLKGENAYEDFGKIYEDQIANLRTQLDEHQRQATYYEKMMLQETDEEARKKYAELHREALAATEETLEALAEMFQEKLQNEIKILIQQFNESMGLPSVIKTKWEIQTEYSEEYLDPVEKAYELQTLTNKINQSIADTDSVYAQKQLNKFVNEELKMLKEKDKLSRYELERANALYELELKKIALAEAQNNKTQMRLRRDASGNYSYQFVADEDEIAKAQQDLLDAQNNLYQLDREETKKKQQQLLEDTIELGEVKAKLAEDITEEERKSLELQEQQLTERILENGNIINEVKKNLGESALDLTKLVEGDISELNTDELLPSWVSATDELIEKINNGDFEAAFELLGQQITEKTQEVNEEMKNLYKESEEAMDAANENATEWGNLTSANNELLVQQVNELKSLNDQATEYKDRLTEWVAEYEKVLAIAKELAAVQLEDANNIKSRLGDITIVYGDTEQAKGDIASYDTGGYTGEWNSQDGKIAVLHQKEIILNEKDTANMLEAVAMLRKFNFEKAMMEMQVTAQQNDMTSAMDSYINSLKEIDLLSYSNSINKAVLAASASIEASIQRLAYSLEPTFSSFAKMKPQSADGDIFNIEINAEFPDATDAEEIRKAFLQLTNIATQRAYTIKR